MPNTVKETIKWYKRYNTWKTVLAILTPIASGEVIAYFAHIKLPAWTHTVVAVTAIIVLYIKMFVKDENKDGKVD